MLLVGSFERNLDDKARVALPAAFRDRLGLHCYLALGEDKCVTVMPADVFEAEAADIAARVRTGEISRNQARALAASATLVTPDKQGRIVLEEALRTYAGLTPGEQVVIAGNFDRLEIWSSDRFARVNDEGTGSLAGEGE